MSRPASNMKMSRVHFYVSESRKKQLEQIAERTGKSMSEILRDAVSIEISVYRQGFKELDAREGETGCSG